MTGNRTATAAIELPQPPARVWEALTRPDLVRLWMFGAEVVSDWKKGSTVLYRGDWNGAPFEDRGQITEIDPPHLLRMNFYSPLSGLPDTPESWQPITYSLSPEGKGTRLTITHENNPDEAAAASAQSNWTQTLEALKAVLAGA